jgi:hypothetical protein
MLRELPSKPESKTLNIELAVIDSGKVLMFFSYEAPKQSDTQATGN